MNPIFLVYFLIHLKHCHSSKRISLSNILLENSRQSQHEPMQDANLEKTVSERRDDFSAHKDHNIDGRHIKNEEDQEDLEEMLPRDRSLHRYLFDPNITRTSDPYRVPVDTIKVFKGRSNLEETSSLPKLFKQNNATKKQNPWTKAPSANAETGAVKVNHPLSNLTQSRHLLPYFMSSNLGLSLIGNSPNKDQSQARYNTEIRNSHKQNQPTKSDRNFNVNRGHKQKLSIMNRTHVLRNRKKLWRAVDTAGPNQYSVNQYLNGTPNKNSVHLQKWRLYPDGVYSAKNNFDSPRSKVKSPTSAENTQITSIVSQRTHNFPTHHFEANEQNTQPISNENYNDSEFDVMENLETNDEMPSSSFGHNNSYQVQNKFFSNVDTVNDPTQKGVSAIFDAESQFSGSKGETKIIPNPIRRVVGNHTVETSVKVDAKLKFQNRVVADFVSNTIRNDTVTLTYSNVTTEMKIKNGPPNFFNKKISQNGRGQQLPPRVAQASGNSNKMSESKYTFTSVPPKDATGQGLLPSKMIQQVNALNKKNQKVSNMISHTRSTPKPTYVKTAIKQSYTGQLEHNNFQTISQKGYANLTYQQSYPYYQHNLEPSVTFQKNPILPAYYTGAQIHQPNVGLSQINPAFSHSPQYLHNPIQGAFQPPHDEWNQNPWSYNQQNLFQPYQHDGDNRFHVLYHPVYQNPLYYQTQYQNIHNIGPYQQNQQPVSELQYQYPNLIGLKPHYEFIYPQAHLSTFQLPQYSPTPSVILRVSAGPLNFQSQESTNFRKPSQSKVSLGDKNPQPGAFSTMDKTPKPGHDKKKQKPLVNPGNADKTPKPLKEPTKPKAPTSPKKPSKPTNMLGVSKPASRVSSTTSNPVKNPAKPLKTSANHLQSLKPPPVPSNSVGIYLDPKTNLLIPLRMKYSDSKMSLSRYASLPCSCDRETLDCYCCVKFGLNLLNFHRTGE